MYSDSEQRRESGHASCASDTTQPSKSHETPAVIGGLKEPWSRRGALLMLTKDRRRLPAPLLCTPLLKSHGLAVVGPREPLMRRE